ncbi:MAG: DNA polymerase, partial [Sciscionella sp.]
RWATRGGAALQLPKALRHCVLAESGYSLVVADAAQLEPRVLAALSGDRRLAEVSASGDLYESLAADSFDGERHRAKVALLSAMYGGTGGAAGELLAVLRKRFPDAVRYVEQAALDGQRGRVVRSRLGRTSPPPSTAWQELISSTEESSEPRSRAASRDWGRFTRNFVVQASASDWALTLLAILRTRLLHRLPSAELVFFLHDEIIVHCPSEHAEQVAAECATAAGAAGELVFPGSAVRFPLHVGIVERYSDAK